MKPPTPRRKAKIDVRRSPRKNKAKHSDDESDGSLVKTPLKKGQWVRAFTKQGIPGLSQPFDTYSENQCFQIT
jgi:hypothetical protein